ncbi:hypothetical protein Tco_0084747 [Tanacetum coccineum]
MPCKTGRCAQMAMFVTRFLRYIDTRPNGDALRKCILEGPYTPTIVTTPAVPATENSPAVPEQTTVEQRQLKKCGKPSKVLQQVSLQNNHTDFERYKAFNDRIVDYDKLESKLNETLGLLAQKEIDIKEGLKVKAYKISVVKEKHDELVKQSLLTKSHYEGLVKEKTTKYHLKEIVEINVGKKLQTNRLHIRNPTAQDMEILVKTCLMPLALKTRNDSFAFVHELKQEMHADLKYVESLEDEINELEFDKAEFSHMFL